MRTSTAASCYRVSLSDATWIALIKGLSAGLVNFVLALAIGSPMPSPTRTAAVLLIGCLSCGASLALFVIALRHLGAARTGAYFSIAPFCGAIIAVAAFGEPVTVQLLIAGLLMALGVWLYMTEQHAHLHSHEPMEHEHEHEHEHDEHHRHAHERWVPAGVRHTHRHRHEPLTHAHPHFPDAHHRHEH